MFLVSSGEVVTRHMPTFTHNRIFDVDRIFNCCWYAPGNAVGRPIPSQLGRLLDWLDGLKYLSVDDNPWAEPPEPVVKKGRKPIRGYFEDLYSEPCRIQRNGVKIVLVGQEGAGKTR